MIEIDITKSYQTRAGKKVRLISDQGSEIYPIVGFIKNETGPSCWTAEGKYQLSDQESCYDLIPFPQIIQTLPYRRFIRKSYSGHWVDIVAQDSSESRQLHYIETSKNFIQWLDTEWVTTSFELHL